MTREETIKILGMLKIAYPKFYQNTTKQEATQTVELWSSMLETIDVTSVVTAVKYIIKNSKWHPSIAEIIDASKEVEEENYYKKLTSIKNERLVNNAMLNTSCKGLVKFDMQL